MFDIGWMELMVIGIVALIVVGPKDLPGMFRTVGKFIGKARSMAREFQRSMEQAADETGLKDAAKDLQGLNDLGLNSTTKSATSFAKNMMGEDDDGGDPGAIAEEPVKDTPAAKGKPAKNATSTKKSAKKPAKAAAKPASRATAKPKKTAATSAKPAAKPKKPAAKPAKAATGTAAK